MTPTTASPTQNRGRIPATLMTKIRCSICSLSLRFAIGLASVAGAQDLVVTPSESLSFNLPFGGNTTQQLDVANPESNESVSWQIVSEEDSLDLVERAVDLLEKRPERLLDGLPDRFSFEGGESGSQIGFGSKSMYSRGNVLNLNNSRISYANFLPAVTTLGEGVARYMTAKLDGLFIFTGEFEGVQEFSISGGLGHNENSEVEVDEFSFQVGGVTWRAFVKKVTKKRIGVDRYRRPSILQMFLVPDAPGISRTFSADARIDGHAVSGLPASTTFHYLLFSRDEGGDYELGVFERLAQNYLEELLPGPRWCLPETVSGTLGGGESSTIKLQIDAGALQAGRYETRLAILPGGLELDALAEESWRTITLDVSPAAFEVGTDRPIIAGLDGSPPEATEFSLVPVGGGTLSEAITVNSSASWLQVESVGNGRWRLQAETSEFTPALYFPELTVSDGTSTIKLPVPTFVESRRITHLRADPVRARLYALSRVLDHPGFVIVYDTATQEQIEVIPLGREPTDFDLTENAEEMIVLNSGEPSITRIDLESLSVIETVSLLDFETSSLFTGYQFNNGRIIDGPGSVIYYLDKDAGSRLLAFDLVTHTVVQTVTADLLPLESPEDPFGFGDMVMTPDGKRLYGWAWRGSDFVGNPGGARAVRFDVDASGKLSGFAYADKLTSPYDARILLSQDGNHLFFQKSLLDLEDLNREKKETPFNAYSISPGRELLGFGNAIYRVIDEFSAPVSAFDPNDFTPDYSWFVGVGEAEELVWTDLSSVVTPEELGFSFSPLDGGGATAGGVLTWTPVKDVRRYAVYLGTDAATLASATSESPEFLGETNNLEMKLPAALPPGETYYWRVVPLGGLDSSFEQVRSFTLLPLTLSRSRIESTTAGGATERRETLGIDLPSTSSWSIGTDEPWISTEPVSGTGSSEISVIMNAGDLEPGTYRGSVTLTVDGFELRIPVELTVFLSYFEAVAPDPEQPEIWSIMGSNEQPKFLVAYNTDAELLTSVVPTEIEAWLLTVHPRDNLIYVAQRDPAVIHGYDPETLEQVTTINLDGYSDGSLFNSGLFVMAAGPAGRLIVEILEADRSVILLIDTGTGEVINEFSLGDIPAGGGVTSPDGNTYYHGDANFSPSDLTKFDLRGDQITELKTVQFGGNSDSGSREIYVSADGNRVVWNGGILDADLKLLNVIPEYLYSVSPDGSFVMDTGRVYNSSSGLVIGDLPVRTSRLAYDRSGENLYLFDRGVTIVKLAEFAELPDTDLVSMPTDGATIAGTTVDLSWEPVPTAFSYSVYFGTDRAAVEAAGPGDPTFLGTATDSQWTESLSNLELGGEYFWRIDMNGFSRTRQGSVSRFSIANIETVPGEVLVIARLGEEIEEQAVSFNSNAVRSWTAVSNDLWIQLRTTEGDTNGDLRFEIDESRLGGQARTYMGSVTISTATEAITLPVEVDLMELEIKLFAADPSRPLIYAANEGEHDHLFSIDGTSGEILDVIRLGSNVTDMVIDPVTDRLIATDYNSAETRVVDLKTFKELKPLEIGSDIYRIEIDPERRTLVTEGRQQSIDIQFFDLDTFELKTSISGGAGDGKLDPANNVYYRAENSSGANLIKYDLSTNPPAVLKERLHGSSIDRFLLTQNGESVVWRWTVYDQDLEITNVLPEEARSLSPGGELAVGQTGIFWLDDGTFVSELPSLSEQSAFTSDGKFLLTFSRQGRILRSISIDSITEVPGPLPHDGSILPERPTALSWTPVEGASSYTLTLSSPSLGERVYENLPEATFELPVEFANGEFVNWIVEAQIPGQDAVTLPTYRFGLRYPRRQTMEGSRVESVAIGPDHILTAVGRQRYELRSFDALTGEIELLEANPLSGGNQGSGEAERASLDRTRGTLAFPNLLTESDTTGVVYSLNVAAYDRARARELLPPPGRVFRFGGDLAVSGGLQMVGAFFSDEGLSRVIAYQTHPHFEQTQFIEPSDSSEGDDFGRSIALFGNVAAISTRGDSSSSNLRLPAIYIFERDQGTGLWLERQKLEIPGADSREVVQSLEINDRFLAAMSRRSKTVHLFGRGTDGQWSAQESFRGDEQRGSSDSFGTTMALAGNRLFVGDPNARIDPQEGGVYSFIFDGEAWQEGVPVLPADPTIRRESFGTAISAWDGWLVVGAGISNSGAFTDTTGHLFEIESAPNHTPLLPPTPVTQALAGQPLEMIFQATDLDGQEGLKIEALQLPAWATLVDEGQGRAILFGDPEGTGGSVYDFQLRVTDPEGASCYEAFRLTLLAPSDGPNFTAEPEDVMLVEGQDLLLRAEGEGAAPLMWQWFYNGQAIPGATRPSLEIAEANQADAGEYRVEVSNVVGEVVSQTALVSVTPPRREAGPWTTYGNTPRRSGYHPALLKRHTFVSAWTAPLQPTTSVSRTVISNGLVGLSGVNNQGSLVFGLDLLTGEERWRRTFSDTRYANPISAHKGVFYYQETIGTNSKLWALSAEDGGINWEGAWTSQSYQYESPAVTDRGVWIGGGYGSGIYGFDLDGTPLFYEILPQENRFWTPMVSEDRLFTWVNGVMREHDPKTGTLLWSIDGPPRDNFYAGVIRGDRAYVGTSGGIIAVDLAGQKILWTQEGPFSRAPALSGDSLHVINTNSVLTFDAESGEPGPSFTLPTGEIIASNQPLLLTDHLIVATESKTYVFDRGTTDLVQEIARGGEISYADGYLLIVDDRGLVEAWFANQAPEFTADLPTEVNSGEAALPSQLMMADYLTDADPDDVATWEVVSSSRPELFENLQIDANTGVLSAIYNPWQWGSSEVMISATDQAGNMTEATLTFTVPEHAKPDVRLTGNLVLNRRTGLFEQTVTITNVALRNVAGFDLQITGLPDGVKVFNASGSFEDGWLIANRAPLAANDSTILVLEYFTPNRAVVVEPEISASIVVKPEIDSEGVNPGQSIDRIEVIEGGVMIEFTSFPGLLYEIQYSDDMEFWKASPTRVRAGGNRTQWIDRGPPRTDEPPMNGGARFYRMRQLPNESGD